MKIAIPRTNLDNLKVSLQDNITIQVGPHHILSLTIEEAGTLANVLSLMVTDAKRQRD